MDIVVPPDGRLNAFSLASATDVSEPGRCLINLSRCTFAEPAGLVVVAAAAERAVREGRSVHVVPPMDGGCRDYLARMEVGRVLSDLGVDHDLPGRRWDRVNDQLEELRRFDSENELERIAGTIINLYRRSGARVVQPLYLALFEFGLNAVQHSGQGGGYVALQAFRRAGDVAFGVADSGVGLRGALARSLEVHSDAGAIAMAARKHLSSEAAAGRGRGITGVIRLTEHHSGSVVMMSGDAHGVFEHGHWDPRVTPMVAPFLGTLAQARLALERRLD